MRILPLLTVLALLVACSDEEATPVTVEEYVELVCGGPQTDISELTTWGEWTTTVEDGLERMAGNRPPSSLQQHYDATIDASNSILEVTRNQPQDAEFDPVEMLRSSEWIGKAAEIAVALEDLPPETKVALRAAGC